MFRFRHLDIYLRLKSFSVGGLCPPGPAGGLKRPPNPSPQVVPTFHFIPSYAPDYNVQYSSKLPLSVMALELNVIVVKLALEQNDNFFYFKFELLVIACIPVYLSRSSLLCQENRTPLQRSSYNYKIHQYHIISTFIYKFKILQLLKH